MVAKGQLIAGAGNADGCQTMVSLSVLSNPSEGVSHCKEKWSGPEPGGPAFSEPLHSGVKLLLSALHTLFHLILQNTPG